MLPPTPKGEIVILINPPVVLVVCRSSSGHRFLYFLIIGRYFLGLLLNGNVPTNVGTLGTEKEPKCSTVVDFRLLRRFTVVNFVRLGCFLDDFCSPDLPAQKLPKCYTVDHFRAFRRIGVYIF